VTERDIFLAVFDLPDPAVRAAYLDRACGPDAALRARVEALIHSHESAGSFLGSPAVGPADLNTGETQKPTGRKPASNEANVEEEVLAFLSPPARQGSLGRIGHYEVLEVLGRGAFGIVFRAVDEVLMRVVAVKVLAPRMAATSPPRKRFLREARAAARVRHANVVQIYAVEEQPLPYLVMEFVPGETLQQRLDRAGPLDPTEAARLGVQIAEGLAAAHATGLVHRDIKPANILIEADPQQVKITDFGVARTADDASLTQSGIVAGTPMFMSPEQARGELIDHRSDLFSLGSVLYTMCSGRPPFRANGALAVLKRVVEDTPRPIPEIIPEVPRWLCDVISRLHAKKPGDRFASARDLADELSRGPVADRQSASAQAIPGAIPGDPPVPRRRTWFLFAALALLLLGVGISEAVGVGAVGPTVVRLFFPEGTLVIEVEDPTTGVTIDGGEMVITGAGTWEIRLRPGQYKVTASRDGKTLREELVTVARYGRRVVRVSREPVPQAAGRDPAPARASQWERSVAALSAEGQVEAVAARLKQLNPGFDGAVTPAIEGGVVRGLQLSTVQVTDLSPVRALRGLRSLCCRGAEGALTLADLSPLKGMQLTALLCDSTRVADLSPLRGMPLRELAVHHTRVTDLAPLVGMPLEHLNCSHTPVADLSPLKGMKLVSVYLDGTRVSDLSPLRGMPLKILNCRGFDLQPKRDGDLLRSLEQLESINSEPAGEFLKNLHAGKGTGTK
jgi:hypothetical protein